jgi:hypothetical protein
MISPEMARKISDSAIEPIVQKEVEKISKFIENAAKRGSYSIAWSCKPSVREAVADIFRKQGYGIYTDVFSSDIKIFWGRQY